MRANSEKFIQSDNILDSDKTISPYTNSVSTTNSTLNPILKEKDDETTVNEPLFGKMLDTETSAHTINFENTVDPTCLVIHANKDLKYISQYLPNNPCDVNVDHHDSENEKQHLHKHRGELKQNSKIEESINKKHSHSHSHGHSHGHSHKNHIYK